MSRFRFTVSCEFDTAYPITAHTEIARKIVSAGCPRDFGFIDSEKCTMTNCSECWFRALERGVKSGCKSVHVERLD